MPTKFILSFLKAAVTILLYVLIFITLFFLITSILNIMGNGGRAKNFTSMGYDFQVKSFEKNQASLPIIYSTDSAVRYHGQKDRYALQIEPRSTIGYYTLIMRLIFMGLGIAVLWNFSKVFYQTNLDHPFKSTITKRLKILAALFIISDILKLLDYFLFNSFLHQSIPSSQLKLIADVGDGIVTGLIIWIIAIIFERGIALQEENALTV